MLAHRVAAANRPTPDGSEFKSRQGRQVARATSGGSIRPVPRRQGLPPLPATASCRTIDTHVRIKIECDRPPAHRKQTLSGGRASRTPAMGRRGPDPNAASSDVLTIGVRQPRGQQGPRESPQGDAWAFSFSGGGQYGRGKGQDADVRVGPG